MYVCACCSGVSVSATVTSGLRGLWGEVAGQIQRLYADPDCQLAGVI